MIKTFDYKYSIKLLKYFFNQKKYFHSILSILNLFSVFNYMIHNAYRIRITAARAGNA